MGAEDDVVMASPKTTVHPRAPLGCPATGTSREEVALEMGQSTQENSHTDRQIDREMGGSWYKEV